MTRWRRTTACERAAQWVSLELDGELGRLEQAALARHLRRCDRCRASSDEVGAFTALLREAVPVEPARAIPVVTPAWARRRAGATTLGGGALALAAVLAAVAAIVMIPHSGGNPSSKLGFSDRHQQHLFAREHVLGEPTVYVVKPPAPSLTPRALL
ncbi:MAG TPA: zf-HC2 domain-containing protein [Gaiellaceae bacterium]|nr:zf-HC2 domain-containing protein [Gaiellaceae bacterium]